MKKGADRLFGMERLFRTEILTGIGIGRDSFWLVCLIKIVSALSFV